MNYNHLRQALNLIFYGVLRSFKVSWMILLKTSVVYSHELNWNGINFLKLSKFLIQCNFHTDHYLDMRRSINILMSWHIYSMIVFRLSQHDDSLHQLLLMCYCRKKKKE